MISNLDELFATAVADWNEVPFPPIVGKGSPQVLARTISIAASVFDLFGAFGYPTPELGQTLFLATLYYTPATTIRAGVRTLMVPAYFSGTGGFVGATNQLSVTVAAPRIEVFANANYATSLELLIAPSGAAQVPPLTAHFGVTPPGGEPGPGDDPNLSVSLSGEANVNGLDANFAVVLSNYAFHLIFKSP